MTLCRRALGASLLGALLVLLEAPVALCLWPKPEAVTPGTRTLCLARHLRWEAAGFSSDILVAGFER